VPGGNPQDSSGARIGRERPAEHPYAEAAVGEATVRKANASRLNELGRRGLVRV